MLKCDLRNLFTIWRPMINEYLSKFFNEVRKVDGSPYPPKTLGWMLQLMNMLAKELRVEMNLCTDLEFKRTRDYLDTKMKELTANGYQAARRQAAIVTDKMEEDLFNRNILGIDNPNKLMQTVYFLVGKHFALRSRQEHRDLKFGSDAQIKIEGMGMHEKIVYREVMAKNNRGGAYYLR